MNTGGYPAMRSVPTFPVVDDELGAYGLRVHGLEGAARWMQRLPSSAPAVTVEVEQAPPDASLSLLDNEHADLALVGGGRLRAHYGAGMVSFGLPFIPSPAELLHPYLAPAAALLWQWAGREALHAGSVRVGNAAVLVFGPKAAGKSTLLAWLSRELGVSVIADDLAVIDRGAVLAGPRSIDLRPQTEGIPGSERVRVRYDERRRVALEPAPLATQVAGSVLLEWGKALEVVSLPPTRRIELLASQRTYPPLAGDPAALLELAGMPMVRLIRPRGPQGLRDSANALLDQFS